MNICPDCKKKTLPLCTYSRGLGHAEHHHYCKDCNKTYIVTLADIFPKNTIRGVEITYDHG